MEFLLANHPLDCPICDQAGECTLQEYSVEHGKGQSRFREKKVKKPKNVDVGPRVRLDDERCIMCSRCIRFTDEIADDPFSASPTAAATPSSRCIPAANWRTIIPSTPSTSAPSARSPRTTSASRCGFGSCARRNTIDVNCATGCNVTVFSRQNKIYRIVPRQNNDVNSDWMPDSHRLSFHWIDSDSVSPIRW